MSGGHFNYAQYRITDIADSIEIAMSDRAFNHWSVETQQEFQNALYALKRAYVFAQRIDYLLSGDDGENTFHDRLKEELAKINCPAKCKNCCSLTSKERCSTCGTQPLLNIEEPENDQFTTKAVFDKAFDAAYTQTIHLNENKELADTAMKFVDRAGDTCDIDTAEEICKEFYKAMAAVVMKYHPNNY